MQSLNSEYKQLNNYLIRKKAIIYQTRVNKFKYSEPV